MRIIASYSDKIEYCRALANGVIREYNDYFKTSDLRCEIGDRNMTFIDDVTTVFIQPLEYIIPNSDDLEDDIQSLSDDVIGAAVGKLF